MKQIKLFSVILYPFYLCLLGCQAQPSTQNKTLPLINAIALPEVGGRIDHLAFDPISQRIFIAALGANSVEVVDLKTNKSIHSIQHLSKPQGIVYIPESAAIFVANGNSGACDVFNGNSFQKITSIQLPGEADNVRYDSINRKIYVGYGDGGVAVVDAVSFKQVGDIKLEGHPESFQLDISAKRVYVNVPDKQQVEIIDIEKKIVVDKWKLTEAGSNFPMSLDPVNHRLFIGCRRPAKLLVLDAGTGKLITAVDTNSDVDDIFYDQKTGNIYLSCGEGYVDIFKESGVNTYQLLERIASRSGARTSLLIPQLNQLIVASPKSFSHSAALLIYGINN